MEPIRPTSPPARHWRISVPVSLGILLLLASLVVAAMSLESQSNRSSAPSLTTSTSADNQRWYSLGYVDIDGGVTPLYPVQPGRVKSIEARENEFVKAGQPLFRLEDTVPQQRVSAAKAAVQGAQGQLRVAQSEADALDKRITAQHEAIEAAKIDVKRARALSDEKKKFKKDGIGGKFEAEDAAYQFEKAQRGVRGEQEKLAALEALKGKVDGTITMALADLKGKQALLAEAENAVKECVVRAPDDGTLLRININVGETLGANPRQPAIQFASQRPLLVRAEPEQEFVDRLAEGQNVIVEDNVTSKECARGKVASIANWYAPRRTASPEMLSVNGDVRTLECIIKIDSRSRGIRIGQRVRVRYGD